MPTWFLSLGDMDGLRTSILEGDLMSYLLK